ncbi:hypothetical protein [Marinicellulosiphila megalodicopiae]|uniref:hypothetical protein n=1 Tax=Marinicellulosiphila megalodicopiae TaxID=2724896 RepID=UPI003BB0EE9D
MSVLIGDSQCEYEQNEQLIVNSGTPVISLLDAINNCLVDANFTNLRNWSEAQSTLIYEIIVADDDTNFLANSIAQDLDTDFAVLLKRGESEVASGYSVNGNFDITVHTYLDAGTYTLEIKHTHSNDMIPDVYLQILSENTMVSFLEEKAPPAILAQQHISKEIVYELTVSDSAEFYFDTNFSANYFYLDYLIANAKGVTLFDHYFDASNLSNVITLDAGAYYLYMQDVDSELDFLIKSFVDVDVTFAETISYPELVTNKTAHSAILDTDYTVANYTAEISESNYSAIVDATNENQNQNLNLLNSLLVGEPTTTTTTEGAVETTTRTYACEVSGTIRSRVILTDGTLTMQDYLTENCEQNSGVVEYYYQLESEDNIEAEYYSYTQENGLHITVDKKDSSNHSLSNEIYIDLEGLGSFFVRSPEYYDNANYFGKNDSYLFVGYSREELVDDKICHSITLAKYDLNGTNFDEEMSEQNNCVEDFNIEVTNAWSQPESMLEFSLIVAQDNTDFSAFFGTTEQDYKLDIKLVDSAGVNIITQKGYGQDVIFADNILAAGTYQLFISNTYYDYQEVRSDVYFQIKAVGATLNFVQEYLKPEPEVASILDVELKGYDTTSFQIEVTSEAYFTIAATAHEGDYLSLTIYDQNNYAVLSSIKYGENKASSILKVGTYTLSLYSYNSNDDLVDVVIKSDTAGSAIITEEAEVVIN